MQEMKNSLTLAKCRFFLRTLVVDTSYDSYMDSDNNWNFSTANELDITYMLHFYKSFKTLILTKKQDDEFNLINNLRNTKVLVWRSKSAIVFHSIHQSAFGGKDNEVFAF